MVMCQNMATIKYVVGGGVCVCMLYRIITHNKVKDIIYTIHILYTYIILKVLILILCVFCQSISKKSKKPSRKENLISNYCAEQKYFFNIGFIDCNTANIFTERKVTNINLLLFNFCFICSTLAKVFNKQ